jgi:H+/Cl- antiporter ClcA
MRGTLGLGLLVAILIAKMLTFAVSQGSGFVGRPIFPSLFIGGTAGVIVHQAIPSVPLGLAFTCLLAAVPGALAPAPFSMVLMAAFLTQVGGAADRTHPDRRHHRFPHHGSRQ